jgi:hypothetical protein
MSKGTFSALLMAICALSSTALGQDTAAQETGAVETAAAPAGAPSSAISPGKLRILGGLHFGGGGNLRVDPNGGGVTVENSLKAIVGLQAGVDYVLMRYFALGGELRFGWWNTKNFDSYDVGRSTFIDLDVKPRGRYAFDNIPLEVYGTMPMGLTLALLNNDINADGGAGFNLGFGGGANYFFTERFGINSEMLGVFHWFKATYNGGFGDYDAKMRTGQFYLFVNAIFAL